MPKNVTAVYFSPTGNTRKYLSTMALGLDDASDLWDVTLPQPSPRSFGAEDFVLLGTPVYVGRVPQVARIRLRACTGHHTPCIVAVTYGNRHYDDALLELAELAQKQGFCVMGAAALVGRHTYGEVQVLRPDEEDLAAAAGFARSVLHKPVDAPAFAIPGNHPYREGGQGGSFRPQTLGSCVRCGLCAEQCPVGAIAPDCQTIASKCLSCFRCIRICPHGAKTMQTQEYLDFAEKFTQKLKDRRENEYYL